MRTKLFFISLMFRLILDKSKTIDEAKYFILVYSYYNLVMQSENQLVTSILMLIDLRKP